MCRWICAFVAACLFLASTAPAADEPTASGEAVKEELHVVGIYEGSYKTDGKIHGGRASVKVDRPGKEITLVLSSYDSVTWDLTWSPETKVTKVILAGYHKQAVKPLPEGAELVEAFYEGKPSGTYLRIGYQVDADGFRSAVQAVKDLTGQEIASFQGAYAYKGKPYVVDKIQEEPRLRSDYPQPTPLKDIPKIKFSALHFIPGERHESKAAYGDFTLAGPVEETLKPLAASVKQLIVSPDLKETYGLGVHDLVTIDPETRKAAKVETSLDVPRPSWPRGMTFDSKRKRILFTGSNYLYAMTPEGEKWEVISELGRGLGFAALAYDAKKDCLYAVGSERGGDESTRGILYELNMEGAVTERKPLAEPIFPGLVSNHPIGPNTQLVAQDGHLILLVTTGGHDPNSGKAIKSESFIYLIDLKADKTWLTARY